MRSIGIPVDISYNKEKSFEMTRKEMHMKREIEEKIFAHKRIDEDRLITYGFTPNDGALKYEADFADGDFHAVIRAENGKIFGKVIDRMNDEEYDALRNTDMDGAYVNSVRAAYEKILSDIAESCCADIPFASDQANRIAEAIERRFGMAPDFPFSTNPDTGAFRHTDSGRWFAVIMYGPRCWLAKDEEEDPVNFINLKIDKSEGEALRRQNGIFEGYHMNHKQWISVFLDDTVDDDRIMELVDVSFRLTQKK